VCPCMFSTLQEGLAHLLLGVTEHGDSVLMLDVAYPSYWGALQVGMTVQCTISGKMCTADLWCTVSVGGSVCRTQGVRSLPLILGSPAGGDDCTVYNIWYNVYS
jgi:hypothetical protein